MEISYFNDGHIAHNVKCDEPKKGLKELNPFDIW